MLILIEIWTPEIWQELPFLELKTPFTSGGPGSPQSRQSAKPFLQSSELGLPRPLTCTLGGERGVSDEGTYTEGWGKGGGGRRFAI